MINKLYLDEKGLVRNPKNNKGYKKPTKVLWYNGKKTWQQGRCRICNRFLNKDQYELCSKHQKERDRVKKSKTDLTYRKSEKGIAAEHRRMLNPDRLFYIKTRNYVIYNIEKLEVGVIF